MTQMEASSHLDTGNSWESQMSSCQECGEEAQMLPECQTGYVGPQIEVSALLSQSSGARNVGPAAHKQGLSN